MSLRRTAHWKWLVATLLVAAAAVGLAETPADSVYVLPKFSADPSAELILSNLSPRLVTADLSFYDPAGGFSTVYVEIAAGGQMRSTPTDWAALGAQRFDGTVVVRASGPLSIEAKVPTANGFKTLEPSHDARNLTLPFSQGTLGSSEISIYNDNPSSVTAVLIAVAENGATIGQGQVIVPGHATRRDLLQSVIPAVSSSSNREGRDVSHVLVKVASNFFGPERRVFALASLTQFADIAEGIRQRSSDTALVQAVPDSGAALSGTVPLFVDGAGYFSLVQVINTTQLAGNVTLTARDQNGTLLGVNPVVVPLPAGGAMRRSVENLFNLPSGVTLGSITVESSTPTVTSAAIGSSAGALEVIPAEQALNTNFAFANEAANPRFFTGLTFLNPGSTPATLTLRGLTDDGRAVAKSTQRISPKSSITRNLIELLPEFRNAGFIHVVSDTPIAASVLYGRSDNTFFTNRVPMHSQPDYVPPDPTTFVLRGVVRHNSVPFTGIVVQLSGPINAAAVTDEFGNYVFQNVPNGSYMIRAAANGYAFSPSPLTVTVNSDSSYGNDLAASLVVPTISSMQPKFIVTGSGATQLILTGSPLTPSSEIVFEGQPLPTALTTTDTSLNAADTGGKPSGGNQTPALSATLLPEAFAVPRMGSVTIRTTGPGGSVSSAPVSLPIGNAAPVLTALGTLPQPLLAGNAGFTTTITGTGFVQGVTVMIQGVARPTTFLSSTNVQVRVPPEDLANGQFLKVTAINPAPTIGPSNSLDLPVMNPTPGVLSVSPNTSEVRLEPNAPPVQIIVTGFGFKDGAQIRVGTFDIPTTFIRSTQLFGQMPPSALKVGGALPVVVNNPAPTVATSEALPFLLVNLPPVLNSIDPGVLFFDSTRPSETYAAPIIMQGSNFGPNSIFELVPPCAPPADPSGGTGDGTGSGSGGTGSTGGSGTGAGPGPGTGSGTGSGTSGSGGSTSGSGVSSTLVSSHEAIMSATIACIGTYQVRVRTPQPGGGISQTLTFDVSEYSLPSAPVIGSLSPSAVAARSASFTLVINGSNFQNGAVVSFGSAVLFPSTVTSTSIRVTVPSYLIAQPDVIPVVVTNPTTTGSSNRLLFTVY